MNHHRIPILALFAAAVCVSPVFADGNIVVAAQEAEATVAPRSPDLRLINLPALTFSLRAAIQCKGESLSVTMSVADTYTTLDKAELAGQRAAEAMLTVPADQLALTASSKFCIEGDSETTDELLVPGITTAQGSLQCASDAGVSVHYASVPLQVRLRCDRGPESGPEGAQDPSTAR